LDGFYLILLKGGFVLDIQLVDQLVGVLKQETKVYDDILRISKNKTNTIIKGKVAELENIVKLEQALVMQIGKLEGAREKLVEELSAQLDMQSSEVTISDIVSKLKGEQADALKEYQEKMSSVLGDLRGANDLNSKLIKNSLDYISFSVNILTTNDMGSNNYGSSGSVSDSKKRRLFDVKL
jgi:flagellar biosynthesis/type III secretory pathway chaperone